MELREAQRRLEQQRQKLDGLNTQKAALDAKMGQAKNPVDGEVPKSAAGTASGTNGKTPAPDVKTPPAAAPPKPAPVETADGGKGSTPKVEKPILAAPEPSYWEKFKAWGNEKLGRTATQGAANAADDAANGAAQAEGALAKTGRLAALVERYPGLKKVPVIGKWLVAGTIIVNIGSEVMDAKPTTTTQAKAMAVGRGVQAGAEALYPPVQVGVGVIKGDDRKAATGLGAIAGMKAGAIAGAPLGPYGIAGGGIVGMFAGAAGAEWMVGLTPEEKKSMISRYGNYNSVKTEGRTIAAQYGLPVDGIKTKDGKVMGIEEIMRDPTKLDELSKHSNFQDAHSREGFMKLAELGSNYNKTYQILQQDAKTLKDTGHSRQEWEEKGLIQIQMDFMKGKPGGSGGTMT